MGNYGIKVSRQGSSTSDATGADILLNTSYPIMKLDSTDPTAFKTINLTFTNDPPNPVSGGASIETLVYSYAHGYNYVPRFWSMGFWSVKPSNAATTADYFYGTTDVFGIPQPIATVNSLTNGYLQVKVDDSTVYFYITKSYNNLGIGDPALNFTASVMTLRVYTFVDSVTE